MASKKTEKIKLLDKEELKETALKYTKELIEGPYEMTGRDFEIVDEKTEWSDVALSHLHILNMNLIESYPFSTFFDKSTGELVGMFDGCLYNTPTQAHDREKVTADEIIDKIKPQLELPPDAKLAEMNEIKEKDIKVDLLGDIKFPKGNYLHFIWRREGTDDENKSCDAYYNRDTKKLTYYFKNW
jgi:hypothetical protein